MRVLALLFLCALFAAACAPTAPIQDAASSAAACASCHPDHTRDHARSRHANAANGELYRALRDTTPNNTRAFCDSCHRPEVGTSDGLSCDSCHRAVANFGTSNARLRWDRTGPLSSARAESVGTPAHGTRFHGFLPSSELCGTCHEVEGPGAFRETPYTEWQRSPAARVGDTCVSCHGSPTPGRPTPRPMARAALDPMAPSPDRPRTDHRFVGPDDDPESAARLLVGSATLTIRREGTDAVVTVTSAVSGHSLPTGVRAVRELWLEVSTVDRLGRVTVVSGALDGDQELAPPPSGAPWIALHDELSPGLPTEATIVRVRALEPAQSVSARFPIAAETATVRARLRYRSQSQSLRRALGLRGPAPEPIDVATAELL